LLVSTLSAVNVPFIMASPSTSRIGSNKGLPYPSGVTPPISSIRVSVQYAIYPSGNGNDGVCPLTNLNLPFISKVEFDVL